MNGPDTRETEDPMDACKEMMGGTASDDGPKESCPMASMCKGMIGKPESAVLLMIPGAVFILAGILILIEPRVLFWLVAGMSILIGVMMLFFANFVRKATAGFGTERT